MHGFLRFTICSFWISTAMVDKSIMDRVTFIGGILPCRPQWYKNAILSLNGPVHFFNLWISDKATLDLPCIVCHFDYTSFNLPSRSCTFEAHSFHRQPVWVVAQERARKWRNKRKMIAISNKASFLYHSGCGRTIKRRGSLRSVEERLVVEWGQLL